VTSGDERRILVVDDDEAIRTMLFTILRRRGFKVDLAGGGAAALERIAGCHYAVLLLDLMMPMVNGYDVLAKLAERDRADRPLVIVLTAGAPPRNLRADLVAGTVRKPFDIQLLVDTVAACAASCSVRPQVDGCPPADSDTPPAGPN
jgi:CheY-like chemotaxis protein